MPRFAPFLMLALLAMTMAGASLARDYTAQRQASAETACGAETYAAIIGKPWAPSLLDGHKGTVRILAKNAPATMDYLPTRLNVMLDGAEKVETLRCG